MNLGVDPAHADQMVRGVVSLPHGTGKTVRVAVFAQGDKAEEARAAGADIVGAEDLAEKVQAGQIDFDRCIATPDMMALVGRLGKILGPRGLMPNPKLGTVTQDVAEAVKAAKGGQVEFRVEKAGIVHAGIGKASFTEDALVENVRAFVDAVSQGEADRRQGHLRQEGVSMSSTMGPGAVEVSTSVGALSRIAMTSERAVAAARRRRRRREKQALFPRDLSETAGAVPGHRPRGSAKWMAACADGARVSRSGASNAPTDGLNCARDRRNRASGTRRCRSPEGRRWQRAGPHQRPG